MCCSITRYLFPLDSAIKRNKSFLVHVLYHLNIGLSKREDGKQIPILLRKRSRNHLRAPGITKIIGNIMKKVNLRALKLNAKTTFHSCNFYGYEIHWPICMKMILSACSWDPDGFKYIFIFRICISYVYLPYICLLFISSTYIWYVYMTYVQMMC